MLVFIFILGAVFASFVNATIYRVDNKFKYPEIFTRNSHCEKCKHPLSWIDLLPILGFIINRGKCKYCGCGVNIYYPISELLLGLSFLVIYAYSLPPYVYAIALFLFILCYFDVKEMAVPKNITHIFLAACVIIFLLDFQLSNIYVPLLVALLFLGINLVKKSFGIGDILIILGLGILMTWQQSVVFFWLSILLALLYASIYMIYSKVSLKKAKIPMVPSLAIAYILALVYGEQIFWYIIKVFQF